MSTPRLGLWLLLALGSSAGKPVGAAEAQPSVARTRELSQLVLNDCGSCHGLTLRGGLGPALLPTTLGPKGQAYVAEMIRAGNPENAMPGWGKLLSPTDINWIAETLVMGRLVTSGKP